MCLGFSGDTCAKLTLYVDALQDFGGVTVTQIENDELRDILSLEGESAIVFLKAKRITHEDKRVLSLDKHFNRHTKDREGGFFFERAGVGQVVDHESLVRVEHVQCLTHNTVEVSFFECIVKVTAWR